MASGASAGYDLDTRIVATGFHDRQCDDLAEAIVNCLIARLESGGVIIHDNESGVATSFAMAAMELVVATECRVIDRGQTGHPTIGSRNRELYMGSADMCIGVHRRIASCPKSVDCVRQALQQGIPAYLIDNEEGVPMRLKARDKRLT